MKIYRSKSQWLVGYVARTGELRLLASFAHVWQARAYLAAVG